MEKQTFFRKFTGLLFILVLVMACQKSTENKPDQEKTQDQARLESIDWGTDVNTALDQARQQRKPVMMVFTASWCPSCRMMQDSTFTHSAVIGRSGKFIPVRIDVDENPDIAKAYNGNARKYGGVGIPNTLFMSPEGSTLRHLIGYMGPEPFSSLMDSVFQVIQ